MVAVGQRLRHVPTPALCLDLPHFEANVEKIAQAISATGKRWRPHTGCHHCLTIARYLLQHGVTGLTCATVSEAEQFVAAGIRNILLAHSFVGPDSIPRIARLCREAELIVTCDHYVQADQLSIECVQRGVTCRVLVEINIGMDRTGVRPGHDTLELARGIVRLPGLKLAGFTGYEGHVLSISRPDERRKSIEAAHGILAHTRHLFDQNGLCREIISAGGSASLFAAVNSGSLTEIRAGAAIFGSECDSDIPLTRELAPALTVLATVVSRPAYDRAVLDCGQTTLAANHHDPAIKNWPDAKVTDMSTHHTVLQLGPDSLELRIGDKVELIVDNPYLTTRMYDQYLCFRDDRIENVWQIEMRDYTA